MAEIDLSKIFSPTARSFLEIIKTAFNKDYPEATEVDIASCIIELVVLKEMLPIYDLTTSPVPFFDELKQHYKSKQEEKERKKKERERKKIAKENKSKLRPFFSSEEKF